MKALYKRGTIGNGKLVHFITTNPLTDKPEHALCNCDYATYGMGWGTCAKLVKQSEAITCLRCLTMINARG